MNCSSCGLQLPAGAANCPRCGAATPYNYSAAGAAPNDPTYISTPYSATQQTPSTPYATPPYGTTPPAQYAGPPQEAPLPTLYAGPPPYEAAPQAPSGSQPYAAIPQNPYSQNPYSTPSYTPYSAAPPTPAPVPPIQPKRPGNRIGIIVGVVVLVLILIGGGVFVHLFRFGAVAALSTPRKAHPPRPPFNLPAPLYTTIIY